MRSLSQVYIYILYILYIIYIYRESGSASAYHDWEFRTRIRVLQHKEKQKRELLKELRVNARRMHVRRARADVSGGQDVQVLQSH